MSMLHPQSKSPARAHRHAGDDGFVLEMMEPRILMSGAPVDLPQPVVDLAITPPSDASTDQVVMMMPGSTSLDAEITATPSAILLQSSFGETEALPAATEATVEPLTPENADQSAELKTVQVTAKADEKAAEPLLPAALEVGLTDSKAQPASNTMTGELVETLRAANGPPAAAALSSDVTNSSGSTIYKSSETGATSDSKSVPAQLILIDGAVSGFSPLIEGLQSGNSNIQVVVLDTQSDGIQQITELLKNFRNLDAIHILAHGGDGALRLGNLILNDSKLAENGQSIASWGAALKPGGDILLYGCDVAQSDKGAQFVSQLAQATGADIAASTNATGAANLGGDWRLEYQTGAIEAGVPFATEAMAAYGSLLDSLPSLTLNSGDTTTVTVGSTVTIGTGGTNYTDLTVTGTAALNGTLAVSIANGFNIAAGQTFDLLTAGNVTGTFTNATGLFNNGGLYFEIVQTASKLQLVVKEVPGNPAGTLGLQISAALQSARDALGTVFNDYFVNPPAFTASLDLAISSFATLSGTFGVEKIGSLITLVAQNATALLSAGSSSAGISAANLAVLLNTDGTRVVYGTGNFSISAGSSFVNASGTVTLTENTTAAATTSQTVTVSGVMVNLPAIAAGVQSLAGTGLTVDVNGFVTLSGDFGFKQGTNSIEIVANNASALLTTSAANIGVNSATFGLLLPSTGGIALSASGTPVLTLPTTFASVGASSVGVDYNSTGAAVNQTLTVSGVSKALSLTTGSVASPYNTVTVTGFTASIADFVTLSGNFGFQKSGTDLLAAATNATARLEAGSTIKAGVTGATVGLIIKADQKFALQTTGGSVSLDLGSGFASASATSINVAYNNTGGDVNTALAITAGGSTVSANVVVANGANAVSVTGLDATVSNFVRITGDFGVRKDSGDLIVAGSNASAVLEAGAMNVGVTGVTLGLIVKPDFTLALQASGAAQLNLGSGFASATATSTSVSYNNTGANVNRTAAVVIGSTSVSAPVVVDNGVTTVTVTGFLATLVDFVTLSGDFGFQKDSGDIIAAATGASASLSVSSVVHAGVSNATFGLLLKSNGTLAIDGNGAADINLGPSFGAVTATNVTVKYNNTGANVARTLTIGSITAPLNALNNDIVVSAAGFNATINNFAKITGDLGFKKTSAGLIVVGQNVDAKLSTGVVDVGITNGKVGLIINPFNRVVLQAEGGLVLNLGSGSFTVGSVTADRVKVEFNNTGVDVNTTVTVGSLSQDIDVKKSTISLSAFNFHAQILDFIDISGDLSFKKLTLGDFNLPGFPSLPTWDPSLPNINLPTIPDFGGVNLPSLPGLPGLPGWPTTNLPDFPEFNVAIASLPSLPALGSLPNLGDFGLGGFSIAGINLDIGLSIPGFSIGTFKADFGMLMDGLGKFALDIHGLPKFDLGLADIGSIGAQEVEVKFNNTNVDVNGSAKDVNGNAKAVQVEKGRAEMNLKGFYAILNNVVQLNGDFGFALGANRAEIIGVGQNVSAKLLPTTPSSVFDLGITSGTMAIVIKKGATLTAKPTIAVSAAGAFQASLGGGLVGVSATRAGLSFNNTGADEDRSFTIGTITQSLKAKAGVTAVTATGLNATISQFVTLTGDFGFQFVAGGDVHVTANNASATLNAGSQSIGVTGATLGMILKADGKIAMQATGPQALNLGVGFASVSATSVTVAYNNTGAAVNTTLNVGGIVAPINVANNTTAISATGLVATISEFVTLNGDFGFSKTAGGDIMVAASGASAKLTAGPTIEIGVSNATIGLLILSNGKIALDASGALAMNLGTSFVSVSATNVTVKYNNTGADVNTSFTMGAVTATINVADGVTAITSTGFSATIVNFVTLTGDFGFKKSIGGDIIVVAQNAAANLVVGGLSVGVTGATVGLIIKPDSKIALQGSGVLNFNLGTAFASVSATSAAIAFNNTGANVNTTVTVGALSAPIVVDDNTIAVSMIGFQASIADFVTLKGDFAFMKSGSDMAVAVSGASATLTLGSFEVGVTSATLGLLVTAAGKIALQASGTPRLVLPGNFDGISASSVTVSYNNTGADVNTTVVIGSVTAPIVVTNNTTSISVTGFEASLLDFVTVKGNFGFQKSGNDLIIAASGASATLKVGTTEVGVTNATLGLIIKDGGGTILQATGAPRLVLPVDFATVTASSVSVSYNSTADAVNTTLNVGGITATVNVAANTTAVTVTGLNATITDFVTISGNFGFKKSGSDVVAIASNASAIMSGGGFSVGLTSASLALLLKSDGSFAVQASGTPVLTIPVDMSSVLSLTITTLSVGYNSTGAAIDSTMTVGTLSAPLKVSSGTKASPYLAIGGSGSITIAGFITVIGDFGFSKTTDGDTTKIKIGAANVRGTGDSDKYALTNGTLGLVLFRKTSNNTSLGYAMEASTTGYLQVGGSLSAQATVTLRRNTTTFAVNEIVPVLTREVPVVFSASEVSRNGTPFNTVSLSDAEIRIGDIIVKGSYASQPNGPNGESITKITDASLEFGDPLLFKITAASVTYKSFSSSVTLGGVSYADGAQQVIITGGEIQLGDVITLSGSFNIIRSKTSGTTLTNVGFTGLGISLKVDGRVMVTVAGDGAFHYGGADGFQLDSLVPTSFNILPDRQPGYTPPAPAAPGAPAAPASSTPSSPPQSITLGPLTLTNPDVTLTNFGLGFSNGKVVLKATVTIGVETASLLSPGGTGAKITDGTDADKFGISGSFDMDLLLDPANNFAPSGVNTGNFQLKVDIFELNLGDFLILKASDITYNPSAADDVDMFTFGSAEALLNAGPLAIGGGAENFSIRGNGDFVAGQNFAITLSLGAGTDAASTFKTPEWLPLKELKVTLRWEDDNFTTNPSKFLIVLDAQVAGLGGLSGLSVSGGFTGLTIDVQKLAAGEFAITDIGSANISVSGPAFGGTISGGLALGILKLDADFNVIPAGVSTPVARRVLYGALEGSFSLPSFGLDIRVGFSDFGPLDIFVGFEKIITLSQATGLSIKKITGGIQFGSSIEVPDPTIFEIDSSGNVVIDPDTELPKIDAKATAFKLREESKAIKIPSDLTLAQWSENLRQRIATLVKNGGGGDLSFDDLTKDMIIYAKADLLNKYQPDPLVFRGDVRFILDITGKIMMSGTTTYGDTLTNDTYFYADLTKVAEGTGKFVFLMEKPFLKDRADGGISYFGVLDFGLVDSTGLRLTASQLQDRYNVTKTTSQPESYVWTSSTKSILLAHNVLKTEPITVKVGSTTLSSSDYTITKGNTLTLNSAPNAGDVVTVEYSYTDLYGTDADGNPIVNPASVTPDADGFQILITGGVRADIFDNTLFYELKGQAILTFTSTFFKVDVEATLEVSYLGIVGTAAGSLTVRYNDNDPSTENDFAIWGALKISSGDGLKKLEDYGIKIQAQLTITINTTAEEKTVDLRLPAEKKAHIIDEFTLAPGDLPILYMSHSLRQGAITVREDGNTTLMAGTDYEFDETNSIVTLLGGTKTARSITIEYDSKDYLELHVIAAPESLNVVGSVLATFSVGDAEFFRMQAALSMTIGSQGFSLILVGKLMVGPAGDPFLTFDTTALIFAGVIDGKGGFAAMFKTALDVELGPFALKAAVLVQVNTFGKAVVLNIPNVTPAFPAITDENGQSLETLVQLTSVLRNSDGTPRLDENGNQMTMTVPTRTVSISGGAPRLQGGFEADGAYFMIRGKGTLNLLDSEINGQFYISLTPNKFRINVSGELTAAGTTYIVAGDLNLVYQPRFYVFGGLLASRKPSGPAAPGSLESYGVYLSATGILLLNTDSEEHTINLLIPGNGAAENITMAKSLVEFRAKASVSFRVAETELFRIEGAVIISVSTAPVGARLLITGDLKIGADTPLFVFKATAAIFVGEVSPGKGGFAAMIAVTLDSSFLPGVEISGGFLFMTNTIGADVNFDLGEDTALFRDLMPIIKDETGEKILEKNVSRDGKTYRQVTIPGGAPKLTGDGNEAAGAYVLIRGQGDVNILDSFVFKGRFGILITTEKFQLGVAAALNLGPFGEVEANGFLEISANGIVGAFSLTVDTGEFGKNIGLEFDASFTFAVNTLGEKRTVTFIDSKDQEVTLEIDEGVRIKVKGTIIFAGVLDADAEVDIQISDGKFQLDGTAGINLAGGLIKARINLHVLVTDKGFSLVTDIDINTTLAEVINITASGKLYINTGVDSVTLGGVTVEGQSVFFELSGKLSILDIFTFDVSITAQVGGTFVREGGYADRELDVGQWAFKFRAETSFFDLLTIGIRGWIMYDGSFWIELSGRIMIGTDWLGFSLDVVARIGYDVATDDFSFGADVTGTFYIFGFQASLTLQIKYRSSDGALTLDAKASGQEGENTVEKEKGWVIGYLERPKPIYLGLDSNGNRLSGGSNVGASGELQLTMGAGDNGDKRGFLPDQADTTYTVSHVSTQSDGSETVKVSFGGRSKEYSGVRKIVLNGTDGKDELYILDGVTSQLQLDGGGGDDTFIISGGSSGVSNVIKGGDGNDLIQISDGNTRSYTISGDGGTNTLLGGNGNDTFYGGSGTDFITAGLGADTFYSGSGIAYILGDQGANGSGSSTPREISSSSAAGSADTFYVKTGTNYIIGGAGNDRIYGGGENYVVGDNGSMEFDSSGKVTKIIAEGAVGGNDYFDSLGGSGTSIFLAGAGSDTIKGGNDTNIVLGGNGNANFDAGKLIEIISDELDGDDDTITLGDGLNVALGGGGKDTITGGNGKSNIGGDNGKATFFEDGKLKEFTDGDINGDDILVAGNGNSVIIGGGGNDTITAGNGNSVLIGDEGTAKFNSDGFLLEITTINPSNGGNDTITAGNSTNVIFGGSGADILRLGVGKSAVIGDNGKATFSGSSILSTITTLDPTSGAADTITGSNGNNVIFGGAGADIINVNDLGDVILGDNGSATFNSAGLLLSLTSSDPSVGDADTITAGIGSNVIFGGAGADQITAGVGNNIILGDSGRANFNIGGGKSILSSVTSTDASSGGADRITAGNGKNIFFGGAGADFLSSGSGFSILAGDGASASFDPTGLLVSIQSVDASVGSGDTIRATDGRTIVLGGAGGDDIATGRSDDVILGDNGTATFVSSGGTPSGIGSIVFSNDGILTSITSTDTSVGGDDIITVSDGFNVIVGGLGADQITGGAERDIVIGDNGRALFDNTGVLTLIESTDASVGGSSNDNIIVGNGPDTVIGGNGKDNIQAAGDISDDVIIGDNGRATFDSTAGQSILRDIISTDTSLGDDDTINAGDGYNIVIGGAGKDLITGGANTDVILGDSGHAVFNADGVVTFITTTSPSIGDNDNITFGAGTNTVFGGVGADTLTGLEGTDVIVGDNGNATFTNTGLLTFITTSDVANGGDDVISTGTGFNTVLGGSGKDNITGGVNQDIVIGDNGNATFDPSSGESIVRRVISTDTTVGDDDIINVGDGFNVILAGFGADQVAGGAGDDVILGDNGDAIFNATGILTYITTIEPTVGGNDIIMVGDGSNIVLSGFGADEVTGGVNGDVVIGDHGNATFTDAGIMTYITTTQPSIGGDDIIKVADGFNVVLAGYGADQVTGGKDRDVVLGDNGNATFTTAGVLTYVTTTEPDIGGDDVITTGDGDNIVIGGFGTDRITGGEGRDVVLGDNGNATFDTTGVLTFITTSDPTIGSDDVIFTGNGFNVIFAGIGADRVNGGTGRDVILGDNGNATFDSTAGSSILRDIISTETDIGGADIIDGSSGNNIVLGGTVNDTITTAGGDDIILGDSGHAVFNAVEILTYITTITPDIGGDDTIDAGDGDNIVFGGFGKDRVTSGSGIDFVLGDNGNATFDDAGILLYLTTTEHPIGDTDTIFSGGGDDIVFGAAGGDYIDGEGGDDLILGDFGYYSLANFNSGSGGGLYPRGIALLEENKGGNDSIYGGDGSDFIYAEGGEDFVFGQGGDDFVFAGYGEDFIYGGEGNDDLTGGPGWDYLDGSWGTDKLNVDIFDVWAGGLPEDTIYGGPSFSNNTQLAFGLPALGAAGSQPASEGGSFGLGSLISGLLGDVGAGLSTAAVGASSSIFSPDFGLVILSGIFNDIRWGGASQTFMLLFWNEINGTVLIGIGEFLEVLWSDLMVLIGG